MLPDLTIPENVELCRQWVRPAPSKEGKNAKGGDPSFLGRCVLLSLLPLTRPTLTLLRPPCRIRLVRIFSEDKNAVVVEQKGAREAWGEGQGEVEMGSADDE